MVGEGTQHSKFKTDSLPFPCVISCTREELLDALPCMGNTQQRPGARDDSDDEDRRTRSDAKNTRRHTPKHSLLRAVNERGLRGRTCHLDNALQRLTSNRARRVELNKAHLGQVDQIVNIRRLIRSDGRVSRSAATKLAVRLLFCVLCILICGSRSLSPARRLRTRWATVRTPSLEAKPFSSSALVAWKLPWRPSQLSRKEWLPRAATLTGRGRQCSTKRRSLQATLRETCYSS